MRKIGGYGILIILGIIFWGASSIYSKVSYELKTHDKSFSFYSYYEDDIKIKVNEQELTLKPLESQIIYSKDKNFKIVATDKDGKELANQDFTFTKKPAGVVGIFTPEADEQSNKCLVISEVYNFYYSDWISRAKELSGATKNGTRITSTEVFKENAQGLTTIDEKNVSKFVMLPGEFGGNKMPEEIESSEKKMIKAIFPIDCKDTNNIDALDETFIDFAIQEIE